MGVDGTVLYAERRNLSTAYRVAARRDGSGEISQVEFVHFVQEMDAATRA